MATYNRTATGGGTVGHPSNAPVPYVITSPVWDTVDGGTGGDIVQLIDVPADTMILAGCLEVLEARGNGQITMDIGFTGGDVDTFLDASACAAGFSPFLEASIGASGSNCRMLTSADTIDALIDVGFDIWVKKRIRYKGIDTWESRTRNLIRCCKSSHRSFTKSKKIKY